MGWPKVINSWRLLRWMLVICWLSTTLYVSIPDYPYGTPLWVWMTTDPNGYLHEVFYIAVGFLVLIDLTYRWEKPKMPTKLYFVKKKVEGVSE